MINLTNLYLNIINKEKSAKMSQASSLLSSQAINIVPHLASMAHYQCEQYSSHNTNPDLLAASVEKENIHSHASKKNYVNLFGRAKDGETMQKQGLNCDIKREQTEVQAALLTSNSQGSSSHDTFEEQQYLSNEMSNESSPQDPILPKSPPMQGIYHKNRAYLYGWVRNQCVKFKIQTETYANCLHLMDTFYASKNFEQNNFIREVLCMIIISTKALEPKVLYTSTVARNNKLSFQQTLRTQCDILEWFQYQISSYNFIRVVSDYMRRWDEACDEKCYQVLAESEKSFILYNKILYFCENQLKFKRALLQKDIKKVFKFVIGKGNRRIEAILDKIFLDPILTSAEQHNYAYEIPAQEEKDQERQASFQQWEDQYDKKSESVKKRFECFQAGDNYGQFLSMIF